MSAEPRPHRVDLPDGKKGWVIDWQPDSNSLDMRGAGYFATRRACQDAIDAMQAQPTGGPDVRSVERQLRQELGEVASSLAAILPPDGLDLERSVARRCESLAHAMCSTNDRMAAQTVIDVMCILWPRSAPEDVDRADWWRTPVGRLCARSLGRDDAESVSHSVAAAMLGVTRGTVAQLVHRGTLDRHPDGGVLRASVLQRLAR